MGILDWAFKRNDTKASPGSQTAKDIVNQQSREQKNQVLILEGTRFPLFTAEASFFDECRKSGQAALLLPFTEFWPINGRGRQAKAINKGTRLLCSSCLVDMAMSFEFSLPGGMMGMSGGMIAVGEGLPGNLFSAAKAAKCPYCGTNLGIILIDHPNYGEITEQDLAALRDLWRYRCQLWWQRNNRTGGICDRCNNQISRDEGYHNGSSVICETCVMKATDSETLTKFKKDPDCFGISELRRARNFKAKSWQLERGSIVNA